MDILAEIYKKEPEYDEVYRNFINQFSVEQGGKMGSIGDQATKEGFEAGKLFNTKYEFYMYALLIGLRKNYKLPFDKGIKKSSFINIGKWGEEKLINYIILCTISKMNIDLIELESMSDKEVNNFTKEVKITMEAYANGGFDIIKSKVDEIGINYFKEDQMSLINLFED